MDCFFALKSVCARRWFAIASGRMSKAPPPLTEVLDHLEEFYGAQEPSWPTEPYEFIVWWHCGYPASDAACERGWKSLTAITGIEPEKLLAIPMPKLAAALKPGGMVPELRALRLKEIAARVKDEFGGDLRSALSGPISDARKVLKKFPNIADPGADRILLFSGNRCAWLPYRQTVHTCW